ncbi:hypothetical protein BMR02_15850 [Methylococcaceae bacterium HT1]|nr:hypothetical protein BMR02_15850 [Methylococcaceae bacterium HT1]
MLQNIRLAPLNLSGMLCDEKGHPYTIGGIAAYCFYWLLVAVPEYPFFIALTLLLLPLFASVIFSAGCVNYFRSFVFGFRLESA